MVIVLIGRAYSGKREVASELVKASESRFTRLKTYTTDEKEVSGVDQYMTADEYDWRSYADGIICASVSEHGSKHFFLKPQLTEPQDVIVATDDPRFVKHIETLAVPFAVVYVDCSYGRILSKVKARGKKSGVVKSRLDRLHGHMHHFEKSLGYSLYVNTVSLEREKYPVVMKLFLEQVDTWLSTRKIDEFRMPTIKSFVGDCWLKHARDIGYFMTDL